MVLLSTVKYAASSFLTITEPSTIYVTWLKPVMQSRKSLRHTIFISKHRQSYLDKCFSYINTAVCHWHLIMFSDETHLLASKQMTHASECQDVRTALSKGLLFWSGKLPLYLV
ncbi:hypothetical protein NPIL_128951 [Nephila pilipes]|uniref:Uncharacterized protein n=1 Tax=Nephila pilipes TaxID=299642 RepID=A0A8X6MNL6_NEPPI|nr:hypothetical protein NPIL_128951 [Nephila pilipes]